MYSIEQIIAMNRRAQECYELARANRDERDRSFALIRKYAIPDTIEEIYELGGKDASR